MLQTPSGVKYVRISVSYANQFVDELPETLIHGHPAFSPVGVSLRLDERTKSQVIRELRDCFDIVAVMKNRAYAYAKRGSVGVYESRYQVRTAPERHNHRRYFPILPGAELLVFLKDASKILPDRDINQELLQIVLSQSGAA